MGEHTVAATVSVDLTPEIVTKWFCDLGSDEMAEALDAIWAESQKRAATRRALLDGHPDKSLAYIGWEYQFGDAGRQAASMDSDGARELIMWLYDGMLTEIRRRVDSWTLETCMAMHEYRRREA